MFHNFSDFFRFDSFKVNTIYSLIVNIILCNIIILLTCRVVILSVPIPEASLEDVFKVFVDFDILELESGGGFALEKLRFKLPTLSSEGSCADPLISADLA